MKKTNKKIYNSYELLKKIIKGKEIQLNTETILKEYLKDINEMTAYSLIDDLRKQGFIEILPTTGLVGPVVNIRPFYDKIREYDFMENIECDNVVTVTIKGYDYYMEIRFKKYSFGISTIVSIIGVILSILISVLI